MNITMAQARTIAGEACGDRCDMRVVPRYSGRNMYGKECLGFAGEFSPVMLGCVLRDVLGDAAYDIAEMMQEDSMGMGSIVYFPGVTVSDAPAPGEDDDEDDY